ncbi:MAG TPA: hypothetical protein VGI93_11565 [Steroidobacteraceae bacterium]
MYSVRHSVHNGRAEAASVSPAHHEHDFVLEGLKAGKLRRISL